MNVQPLTNTVAFSGLLLLCVGALGCGATTSPEPTVKRSTLHTFTSGANGFDTHSHYYDTGEEVVVFDAQFTPELANALMADIKKKTSSPITHVVITHPNPDKFNGATVFQAAGAKIVASVATQKAMSDVHNYKKAYFINTAKMFTDATYPAMPGIDITFEETLTLPLKSANTVTLTVLNNSGVSSTQTVAHIKAQDALIVGDLIHHKTHAWLEGGIVGQSPKVDLEAWRKALEELKAFGDVTVHGGRGESAPAQDAIALQDDYLKRVIDLRKTYLDAHNGPYTQTHHQELAKQIKAAFPQYKLEYMVDFSVYGLFL